MSTERKTSEVKVHVCNACGKNEDEVKKILLLPNYTLCNECIDLAKQLIEEEDDYLTTAKWLQRLGINAKDRRTVLKRV